MRRKSSIADWCHLCGGRSTDNAEIWFPANAEHERLDRPCKGAKRYLRICAACGEAIRRVGGGEVEELIVDRPGFYKKSPATT